MKSAGLVLVMALSTSALVPTFAKAQSNAATTNTAAKRTLKTVIDAKMEMGDGNGFIIRCQGNNGKGLNIVDAMSFSAEQLNSLDESIQNRTAITLVIQGTTIVDIQK